MSFNGDKYYFNQSETWVIKKGQTTCPNCGRELVANELFGGIKCPKCIATIQHAPLLVPNWFERGHIEEFAKRKLTDDEWEVVLKRCGDDLCDHISEMVKEWAEDVLPEYIDNETKEAQDAFAEWMNERARAREAANNPIDFDAA